MSVALLWGSFTDWWKAAISSQSMNACLLKAYPTLLFLSRSQLFAVSGREETMEALELWSQAMQMWDPEVRADLS